MRQEYDLIVTDFFLQVYLDWIQECSPFWLRCLPAHGRFLDLVEPYLTVNEDRRQLRIYVLGERGRLRSLPAGSDPRTLLSGQRVVFSTLGELQPGSFAYLWLTVDPILRAGSWRMKLHRPVRVPHIFGPVGERVRLDAPEAIVGLCMVDIESEPHLLAATGQAIWILDPGAWGEPQGCQCQIEDIGETILGVSPAAQGGVYVVGENRVFLYRPGRRVEVAADEFPAPGRIVAICCDPPNTAWATCGASGWRLFHRTSGHCEEILLPNGGRPIIYPPTAMAWIAHRGLLILEAETGKLYFVATGGNARRPEIVHQPEAAGPVHFQVDAKGLLHVVDAWTRRMHLFFPDHHWVCNGCGLYLPEVPVQDRCPEPGCQAGPWRERKRSPSGWIPWLSLDLQPLLGDVSGPLAVDRDLNVYTVVNANEIAVFSFSRKGVWGEEKE